MNTCGVCNNKGTLSIYFSLKDNTITYIIECPICGNTTKEHKTEQAAINEWEKMCPTLF